MKTTAVRIYAIDWQRLKKIKASKGFPNYAETVGYVLLKFPEMIEEKKQEKGINPCKPPAPIIDADKANKDFLQLGGGRCEV